MINILYFIYFNYYDEFINLNDKPVFFYLCLYLTISLLFIKIYNLDSYLVILHDLISNRIILIYLATILVVTIINKRHILYKIYDKSICNSFPYSRNIEISKFTKKLLNPLLLLFLLFVIFLLKIDLIKWII